MSRTKKIIPFLKLRFLFILTVILIAGGIVGTVLQDGFNLGIDFEEGMRMHVAIDANNEIDVEDIRSLLAGIDGSEAQRIGPPEDNQFNIRVRDDGTVTDFSTVMPSRIITLLENSYGAGSVTELETAFVGSQFSSDLTQQAALLTVLALVLILGYIWFRFRFAYAVSAILTLLHDVAFMVAFIGLFQLEVSTATIAAVLTIIGYSLNDTIVIFDRVRENEGLMHEAPVETVINTSITQSLSRTLITSLTTLLAVLAIFIFTTGQIKDFALNLIVGIIVGTYSSVFIASPTFVAIVKSRRRRGKSAVGGRVPEKAAVEEAPAGQEATAESAAGADLDEAEKRRLLEQLGGGGKKKPTGKSSSRAQRKGKK